MKNKQNPTPGQLWKYSRTYSPNANGDFFASVVQNPVYNDWFPSGKGNTRLQLEEIVLVVDVRPEQPLLVFLYKEDTCSVSRAYFLTHFSLI